MKGSRDRRMGGQMDGCVGARVCVCARGFGLIDWGTPQRHDHPPPVQTLEATTTLVGVSIAEPDYRLHKDGHKPPNL